MATIKTAIQIQDGLSRQFHAMNMAMSTVIDSFGRLEDATSTAVDTSALRMAQQQLQSMETNMNDVEQEIRQADQAQQQFNNQIKSGQDATEKLVSKFTNLALTIGSIFAVGSMFKSGFDRLIGIDTAQAKLQALGHNAQTVDVIMGNALDSVSGTAFRMEEAVNTAASAVAAGIQPGQQLYRYLSLTADAAAIAGTNMNEMGAIFNKVTTSGMIQADELNQLANRGIPIFQMLADQMGVAAEEVRSLASDGQISSAIFLNAVESGFGGAAQIMGTSSFQATMLNIGAAIGRIGAAFLNGASDGQGFFDQVKPLMVDLLNTIRSFEDHAKRVGEVFGRAFSFIYDNWSTWGPLILFTVGALGSLTFALAATTAAKWALNTALLSSPLFWIPVAIMAIIAALYYAIAAINKFAGTSYSATGIVAGLFSVLGITIYNIFAYLWNTIASFWEFVANVGRDPIYAVKRLFYNLASNFLDYTIAMTKGWDGFATSFLNAIITAVNGAIGAWNRFIELLPDGVSSALGLGKGTEWSYRQSITSDLQNMKGQLNDWVGEAPADYWEAPRIDIKSVSGAWDAGYNWGANLFGGLDSGATDGQEDVLGSLGNMQDALDAGNGSGKDTAGNTKKLADSVDLAADDLQYLRDIAERDVINRYVTGEIKVDMSGMQNHITNEMDIDGVIDRFGEKVEETISILADGVDEF